MSTEYSTSCKPSETMIHAIECDMSKTPFNMLYVRSNDIPAGMDHRLYDFCEFQIATSGFQGTSVVCGELWVSYQFALLKPRLFASLGHYSDIFEATAVPVGAFTKPLPEESRVILPITNFNPTLTYPTPVVGNPAVLYINFPSYPMPTSYICCYTLAASDCSANVPITSGYSYGVAPSSFSQMQQVPFGNGLITVNSGYVSTMIQFRFTTLGGNYPVQVYITADNSSSQFTNITYDHLLITQIPNF